MTLAIYKSALNWLGKGYHVLPIQPGTKKQATGFGLHLKQITNAQEAKQYFYDEFSLYNLAVVVPDESFILDFDDWGLYLSWVRFVKKIDDRITTSYTEITPNNGAHVFLSGQIPNGIQLVDHVEIKRIVLVAPSMVNNIAYETMLDGEIYSGSLDVCFFPLSKNSLTVNTATTAPRAKTVIRNSHSKIEAIKANFSILNLMKKCFPKTILRGHGKFLTACCPFHKETEASFWINTEKNIFGCHACKVKGDVINFFALVNGIDNQTAITQMAVEL